MSSCIFNIVQLQFKSVKFEFTCFYVHVSLKIKSLIS